MGIINIFRVNTLWGGVKADGTSFYFTAFSFFCGPLAILVTGLISQFSWTRLSLPVDRGTVLMYSAVGAIFIIGTIGTFYIIFFKVVKANICYVPVYTGQLQNDQK